MNRRPFLKNLTLLGSGLVAFPVAGFSSSLSKVEYETAFQPVFKFITASDGHFGQPETDYITSHQNLIEAIKRESDVDLVVFNGDLIHDDPLLMPEVKKVYDRLLPLPYYVVKGNHDRVSEDKWLEIWGQASNTFFTVKDQFGMILLNSSNEAGDYLCVDQDFLRSALEEMQTLEQVFVFIHISQRDWTRHGIDCQEVLDLIARYTNVKATFHGHDHDVDGLMWNQKKPYFWSGHFGGSWGNPFPSYRVCEVDEQGKTRTALKRVSDGEMLNAHSI
ncbi:metallophosphoesterase [Algoriphagus sp.]|uniref:metallophosphoesterase family protein n=1 Tax=Algoriphagus sp. TaxID=1872435 RepID=UPI003296BBD3